MTDILLIDDDVLLRDMYAHKFEEHACTVTSARGVDEALVLLRGGKSFDLIIFDVVMPGISGFDFLETLAKERLALQAAKVALTNQSASEDKERAVALGVDGYIVKANTIPSAVVEEALQIALKKKRMH